jgi:2,3-bisphosphoglycerate-independent phosphoglycerate mutase
MMNKITAKYRPTMLMILDGWGIAPASDGNAVALADTPNLDRLFAEHPNTSLLTSGKAVGLPDGQMGNSEVGHLNIGAGRTVNQSLTRIDDAIDNGEFFNNPILLGAVENAKRGGGAFHIMGLIGPGGVHSYNEHITALAELAKRGGLHKVYIHAWLDGRDTPPSSALEYMRELEADIEKIGVGKVVTVAGRYYAMDRDNRWDRVEKAYDALTLGNGLHATSAEAAISESYSRGETDEFVLPTNVFSVGDSPVLINDADSVVFANFRPDRARELTRVITEPETVEFDARKKLKNLYFVTMTEYDNMLARVHIAYPPEKIINTLAEYVSNLGLQQLHIAETEKYAHVTFFFNGGIEEPYLGEERILVPSPKVATYDLQPEMSAYGVCERVVAEIEAEKFDLIILNFANMDMVGHTGVIEAAKKAVTAVDECVGWIVEAIANVGGQLLITADHGNSENMLTSDNEAVTAHSTNPVPLILFREDDAGLSLRSGGALSDIAPTLLDMMGLKQPSEMTGHSLIEKR